MIVFLFGCLYFPFTFKQVFFLLWFSCLAWNSQKGRIVPAPCRTSNVCIGNSNKDLVVFLHVFAYSWVLLTQKWGFRPWSHHQNLANHTLVSCQDLQIPLQCSCSGLGSRPWVSEASHLLSNIPGKKVFEQCIVRRECFWSDMPWKTRHGHTEPWLKFTAWYLFIADLGLLLSKGLLDLCVSFSHVPMFWGFWCLGGGELWKKVFMQDLIDYVHMYLFQLKRACWKWCCLESKIEGLCSSQVHVNSCLAWDFLGEMVWWCYVFLSERLFSVVNVNVSVQECVVFQTWLKLFKALEANALCECNSNSKMDIQMWCPDNRKEKQDTNMAIQDW